MCSPFTKSQSDIDKAVEEATEDLRSRVKELEEALKAEKIHSATSDFCLSEWKNDCDELKDLVKRGVAIIETVNPGSLDDKEEQGLWLEDAKAALKGEK